MISSNLKTINPRGHLYTVEIRFWGEALVAEEITQRLNLQPSMVREKKGGQGGKQVMPTWGYNGHGNSNFQPEWKSLDHGLDFLICCLMPSREVLSEISKSISAIWWCGHFQTSFDGGPTLSPSTLIKLSKFKIPFFLDCYHGEMQSEN